MDENVFEIAERVPPPPVPKELKSPKSAVDVESIFKDLSTPVAKQEEADICVQKIFEVTEVVHQKSKFHETR